MKLELVVNLSLKASHSLEERETPHEHLWDIQVGLQGTLNKGRVLSLTQAQERFAVLLTPLQNTLLNNNKYLDSSTRQNPTCENLAIFLVERLQNALSQMPESKNVTLSFVEVGLWEKEGKLGSARVSF
ncbi:MAG: hypothetical protein EB078_05695, partial [Proteobacteria bacterium]|nr:hypothetical protein [Pseudomonadota bacterium]NDD04378.1 hypothetical protein [Pseudomonadota bacterium]